MLHISHHAKRGYIRLIRQITTPACLHSPISLPIVSQEAVENYPEQIGERLRHARETAGLAIEDVVFQTHLPRVAIEALEREDFAHFTSPVYAKSFLSQYSDFLNVEAAPWLDALQPSAFIEDGPLSALFKNSSPTTVGTVPQAPSSGSKLSVFLLLILSIAIIFGAIRIIQVFDVRFGAESNNSKAAKAGQTTPVAPQISVQSPIVKIARTPAVESVALPTRSQETTAEDPAAATVPVAPRAIVVD